MAALANGNTSAQNRVPAWKRLGLKLKYAKEIPDDQVLQHGPSQSPDQYQTKGPQSDERPSKKRRTILNGHDFAKESNTDHFDRLKSSEDNATTSTEAAVPSTEDTATAHTSDAVIREPSTEREPLSAGNGITGSNLGPRRKSVTFTAETKQEDGVSAAALFKVCRAKEEQAATVNSAPPQPPVTRSQLQDKDRTRTGHGELSGAENKSLESIDSSQATSCIEYLQKFHTDKASWKFNKKKQNDLLKHLFDIHRIPLQHDQAIVQYVAGLQGAGRKRVIENATAVLKEIAEKAGNAENFEAMESEAARRTAYGAALKRRIELSERSGVERSEYDDQQSEELQHDRRRGERAEAILGQLLQHELYPDQIPPRTAIPASVAKESSQSSDLKDRMHTSITKPSKKKRKRRTRTGDDASSDSSSAESEGGYKPSRGPRTVMDALSATPDPNTRSQPTKASPATSKPINKKVIFDDELLDKMFPKPKSYHETAPKRKADKTEKGRGFAYTHGTKADESGSESSESSESSSSSESESKSDSE